jgi:carbamoyltransferase
MIIVGINAYHADAAACIIRDGALIAAAEEERFRRIKHWAGFPSQAISYCLAEAHVDLSDVTHVAVNRNGRASLFRKLSYVMSHRPSARMLLSRLQNCKSCAENLSRSSVDAILIIGQLAPRGKFCAKATITYLKNA